MIAETMLAYRRIGFGTFIVELPAPYDHETMETLIRGREADGRGGLSRSTATAPGKPATRS